MAHENTHRALTEQYTKVYNPLKSTLNRSKFDNNDISSDYIDIPFIFLLIVSLSPILSGLITVFALKDVGMHNLIWAVLMIIIGAVFAIIDCKKLKDLLFDMKHGYLLAIFLFPVYFLYRCKETHKGNWLFIIFIGAFLISFFLKK